MAWLKRLFGGTGSGQNTIAPPPSDPVGFWRIIAQARGNSSEAKIIALREALSSLSAEELISFDADYDRRVRKAYRWDLWAAAHVINGGCGDDEFDYFRDWLISQGRDAYEAALVDPASLISILKTVPKDEEVSFEGFRYVVGDVYEKKTGTDLPHLDFGAASYEPAGEPWEEDDAKGMFPQLAEWAHERY